jgi:hypothetical protein
MAGTKCTAENAVQQRAFKVNSEVRAVKLDGEVLVAATSG